MFSKMLVSRLSGKWVSTQLLCFILFFNVSCSVNRTADSPNQIDVNKYAEVIESTIELALSRPGSDNRCLFFLTEEQAVEVYCGPEDKVPSLLAKVLKQKNSIDKELKIKATRTFDNQTDVIKFMLKNITQDKIYNLSRGKSFVLVEYKIV